MKLILITGVLSALLVALAVFLYPPIGRLSPLAIDQGTIAALRSASAIYYGKNDGTFRG